MARRLRACVEAWPECETMGYDPRCCRFPKSCSATVYDEQYVSEDDLEPRPLCKYGHRDRCEPLSALCLVDCTPPAAVERPLCNYGHTKKDHERVGACERPGLGTVYGIRPHLSMTPLEARQMSITYEATEINRPAVELLFDLCTICKERRRACTCHERGYN